VNTPRLDPWFAKAWTVWLLWLIAGVAFFPNIWMDRTILFVFLVLEVWSVLRTRRQDTLSEFMTWIADRSGPDVEWYRSWNALVVGLLGIITYQAAYVASFGYAGEAWSRPIMAVIVGAMVFFWNLYHWLRPDKYGV
jgi:hypothetical protein